MSMSVGQQRASAVVVLFVLSNPLSVPRGRQVPVSTSVISAAAAGSPPLGAHMSPRVIETQYGKLRGILTAVPVSFPTADGGVDAPADTVWAAGRLVESYLGLQYGTLLGGELRFMPPTGTLEKWDGVRVALRHRPVCPQPVIESADRLRQDGLPLGRVEHLRRLAPHLSRQAEECLNLNVYVPVTGIILIHCVGGPVLFNSPTRSIKTPSIGKTVGTHYRFRRSCFFPVLQFGPSFTSPAFSLHQQTTECRAM